MNAIRETLHQKRAVTEAHIRQLQQAGTQGVRYTAMIPDIPFLVCGLLCDLGWLTHLTAVIIWFCRNGVRRGLDFLALLAMAAVVVGCRSHHLSGKDPRKGDRHPAAKGPELWPDGVRRAGRGGGRRAPAGDRCGRLPRAGVGDRRRASKLRRGAADLSFLPRRDRFWRKMTDFSPEK